MLAVPNKIGEDAPAPGIIAESLDAGHDDKFSQRRVLEAQGFMVCDDIAGVFDVMLLIED